MPWFNGCVGGAGVLSGVTGGYLIGFVPAAALIGWVARTRPALHGPRGMALTMLAGVGIIYTLGALQFAAVMHTGLATTLSAAVMPFILWDVAKAGAAALIATTLLPKQ